MKLQQRTSKVEDGRRKIEIKRGEERAGKLLGISPTTERGKLQAMNGAIIIGENYGLALEPEPSVIPFHQVQPRLESLRRTNGGKRVRVLRNGMLIRSEVLGFKNVWQVRSIKQSKRDGILLDLTFPHMIPSQGTARIWSKRDASIRSLMKSEIEILSQCYTGHPSIDLA